MQRRMIQLAILAGLLLTVPAMSRAGQAADKVPNTAKGFTFYESFWGSSNTLGQVYMLDTTVGYDFNKHVGVDVGVPVYMARPSGTSLANGYSSGSGLGDAYLALRLTFANPLLNYSTTLTGTAPTGNENLGFSTGRATYDWNNHFDKTIPIVNVTPFANVGVADTVSDTHFFTRPFTTLGTVAHLEGGATLKVFPMVRVGASLYDIIPSGQQKVFSKLVRRSMAVPAGPGGQPGGPTGRGHGAFQTSYETIGGPALVSDNGASAWVAASVLHYAYLEAGYSRSVAYDLNTFSFGIGFDVGHMIRTARGH
jgi:hypothetical protein